LGGDARLDDLTWRKKGGTSLTGERALDPLKTHKGKNLRRAILGKRGEKRQQFSVNREKKSPLSRHREEAAGANKGRASGHGYGNGGGREEGNPYHTSTTAFPVKRVTLEWRKKGSS